MQVRVNAESAALLRAGKVELQRTNAQFDRLIDTQQKLILREYALNGESKMYKWSDDYMYKVDCYFFLKH